MKKKAHEILSISNLIGIIGLIIATFQTCHTQNDHERRLNNMEAHKSR
jgi:hypothetical protein